METLITYKGFDKDLKCRGKQYEIGKEYQENNIQICKRGFHACESPLDVLDYYDMFDSRFCEVEQSGEIQREKRTTKICSSKIKIKTELKLDDIIKLGIDWLIKKTPNEKESNKIKVNINLNADYAQIGSKALANQISVSGNCTKVGSSGNFALISSSGYYNTISSSGNMVQISSNGGYTKICSIGLNAYISSNGFKAAISSSGDYAKISSSGDCTIIDSIGHYAVIACMGRHSIVRAKKGSRIILSEYEFDRRKNLSIPKSVKTAYVDGHKIKEDTWYQLINGKFKEVNLCGE